MAAVSGLSELFPQTSTSAKTKNSVDELGQKEFLKLMVAQLENQDPSQPMENFEFLSQIAQFGTVSGIQGIQQAVDNLSSTLFSNQALQVAGLVGREVITGSNLGSLVEESGINTTVDIPGAASDVIVYVQDVSGNLVFSQSIGAANGGDISWQWPGIGEDGNPLPAGNYRRRRLAS